MQYIVKIVETLDKEINIDAATQDEAFDKVLQLYRNSEIVLDSNDFTGVEFNVKAICCKQEKRNTELEALNEINNQCSIVQKAISQNFGLSKDANIIKELLEMSNLLENYLSS